MYIPTKKYLFTDVHLFFYTDMNDKTLIFFRFLQDYIFRFLILLKGINKILMEVTFYSEITFIIEVWLSSNT